MKKLFRRSESEAKAKAEAETKAKAEAEAKSEAEAKAEAEAEAAAAAKRSKALYDDMRAAIQNKNYLQMTFIIGNLDYDPNRVGAGDMRTALHTAAHEDDQEALVILLRHKGIDPNVKTTEGLTPFLLAASEGKKVSFKVLLEDSRVDTNARNCKDQSAKELINALDKDIKAKKAMELLANRDKEQLAPKDTTKLALLIGNSEYQANIPPTNDSVSWSDLPGAKEDVTDMKTRLRSDGYQVEVIGNSPDILQAVKDVMNKIPVSSITHLQVLYAGKTITDQGKSIEILMRQATESTR